MILDIIWYIVIGIIVGGLGRLVLPGRQAIGFLWTLLIGVVGALVGGFITAAIIGGGHSIISFIVSVLLAAGLVALYERVRARGALGGGPRRSIR
ncbi:MAG: GlsB/YeaQ/YmgE family stress response membrane protein [Streptosporangiaceae bacterium]